MFRLLAHIPLAGVILYMIAGKSSGFDVGVMRIAGLIITAGVAATVYVLGRRHQASPIHKGMAAFLLLAALAVWFWPDGAGRLFAKYPVALLYAVLFLVAAGPPLAGREVFTMYFARQTTPSAVWSTDIFKTINYHLTALWAALFFCGIISGMIPGLFNLHGPFFETLFEGLLPTAFMLGIGVPANKRYPEYYQRKLGLEPPSTEIDASPRNLDHEPAESSDRPGLKGAMEKTSAHMADSCRELLQMMPLGFNSQAAEGLEAIYQFEISGDEEFVARLSISNGMCNYHDGPAKNPNIVVKTPANVWLAISKGERDGQQAFMNGEYAVEGDLNLLLKLKSLFSSSQS
jgi:putative sterol carrier protein